MIVYNTIITKKGGTVSFYGAKSSLEGAKEVVDLVLNTNANNYYMRYLTRYSLVHRSELLIDGVEVVAEIIESPLDGATILREYG